MRKLLLTFLLFVGFSICFAQQKMVYHVNQINDEYLDLNKNLLILEDSANSYTVNQFLKDSVLLSKFAPYHELKQPLKKFGVYWGQIYIQNNTLNKFQGILYLGQKRNSDFADVYFIHKNHDFQLIKSGYYYPASEKEINTELGSKVKIELFPGQGKLLFIKIHNISSFPPAFNLKIQSFEYFNKSIQKRNFYYALLYGALLIMFLYNLLIFFTSRDKPYLFYALYVITIFGNFLFEKGFLLEFFLGEIPRIDIFAFIFSACFSGVFYLQFTRLFLETQVKYPFLDKAMRIIIWLKVIQAAILLFIVFVSFNIKLVLNIANYANFIELAFGMVIIYQLFKTKDILGKYFILGTLSLMIGVIVSLVILISGVQINYDSKLFMNIGVLLEVLFFSLGLGVRIELIEKAKQKAKEELIQQLKANELLQIEINFELERKVKERTFEIEAQKEILANQNRKITDSIYYAKRIQSALLPDDRLSAFYKEHFIVFFPKDIVSGDFYFVKKLNHFLVIAVADCTGHGVPGAFMSVLGMTMLTEIVGRSETLSANQVLNELRKQVKQFLNQEGKNNEQKDGMDIAIAVIDSENLSMQYSGANNSLIITRVFEKENFNEFSKLENSKVISNENYELLELKPDKMPVGVYVRELESFSNKEVTLKTGDCLYFYTDGYYDQFGGKNGRKFLSGNFKKMLLKIQDKTLPEQKIILEKTLASWKGDNNQVDDITVLGIRI